MTSASDCLRSAFALATYPIRLIAGKDVTKPQPQQRIKTQGEGFVCEAVSQIQGRTLVGVDRLSLWERCTQALLRATNSIQSSHSFHSPVFHRIMKDKLLTGESCIAQGWKYAFMMSIDSLGDEHEELRKEALYLTHLAFCYALYENPAYKGRFITASELKDGDVLKQCQVVKELIGRTAGEKEEALACVQFIEDLVPKGRNAYCFIFSKTKLSCYPGGDLVEQKTVKEALTQLSKYVSFSYRRVATLREKGIPYILPSNLAALRDKLQEVNHDDPRVEDLIEVEALFVRLSLESTQLSAQKGLELTPVGRSKNAIRFQIEKAIVQGNYIITTCEILFLLFERCVIEPQLEEGKPRLQLRESSREIANKIVPSLRKVFTPDKLDRTYVSKTNIRKSFAMQELAKKLDVIHNRYLQKLRKLPTSFIDNYFNFLEKSREE